VNVPVARVITVIQSPLPNWVGVWVVVDVYGGEHANHLLNHRGMRFPPFDRLWDPHDVCDYVWVMCRVPTPRRTLLHPLYQQHDLYAIR
jgi:hypothetical protein